MSRWWRAYDEALHDPKLVKLSDKMHRAWFNILCIASKNDGKLPEAETLAIELRTSVKAAEECVANLVSAGLLDKGGDGRLAPHNWGGRQFQSDVSTTRVKRFRERQRNVSPAVSETPPDTETESKTERKKDAAKAAEPNGSARDEGEVGLFSRGKQVLGQSAGGLIKQLLAAKEGKIPLARAAIETAATKENPREYIGGVLRGAPDGHRMWDPRL